MKRLVAVLWFFCPSLPRAGLPGAALPRAALLGTALLATALLSPGSALARPVVTAVQLASADGKATVELTFTAGTPDFHIFYLANPNRAVIDMAALDWRAAPPGQQTPDKIAGNSLITGLRHGVQPSGAARLVLDLAAPARIMGTQYRRDQAGALHLAFNLQQVSATAFAAMLQPGAATKNAPVAEVTDIVTAAGPTPTGAALRATRAASAAGQRAIAQPAVARAAKDVDLPPLLTGTEADRRADAEARDNRSLKYTRDGYSLSYMRPDGDTFGAGVALGMQF